MARKPQPERSEGTNRDKIVSAFMALLAERPIEEIAFGEIAGRAGLSLAECRAEFASVMGVLTAQVKAIDRATGPSALRGMHNLLQEVRSAIHAAARLKQSLGLRPLAR